MNKGYLYILKNPAFPHLLKIGRTVNDPQKRANEISSSTGVPIAFEIVYTIFVQDCVEFEKVIHQKLIDFRYNKNREFFVLSLDNAIKVITRTYKDYYQVEPPYSQFFRTFNENSLIVLCCVYKFLVKLFLFLKTIIKLTGRFIYNKILTRIYSLSTNTSSEYLADISNCLELYYFFSQKKIANFFVKHNYSMNTTCADCGSSISYTTSIDKLECPQCSNCHQNVDHHSVLSELHQRGMFEYNVICIVVLSTLFVSILFLYNLILLNLWY